jgi:predicted nucleic acid-binding Zn ribbon protein
MGSGIHISCNTCDVNLDAAVGVGFVGVTEYICACDMCKTLVEVSDPFSAELMAQSADREIHPSDPFECAKCGSRLRKVAPNDKGCEEGILGTCPQCGGKLRGEFNGMLWD